MHRISRRRVLLTGVLLIAFAGLAAGLLVGRGSGAQLVKGQPAVLASGHFTSGEWSTKGRAVMVRRADGSLRLQLRNFQTQRAPELWVVLEPADGSGERRQLTGLQRAWGDQVYVLPPELATNPLQRVIIFCAKCNKVWGSARLERVRHA